MLDIKRLLDPDDEIPKYNSDGNRYELPYDYEVAYHISGSNLNSIDLGFIPNNFTRIQTKIAIGDAKIDDAKYSKHFIFGTGAGTDSNRFNMLVKSPNGSVYGDANARYIGMEFFSKASISRVAKPTVEPQILDFNKFSDSSWRTTIDSVQIYSHTGISDAPTGGDNLFFGSLPGTDVTLDTTNLLGQMWFIKAFQYNRSGGTLIPRSEDDFTLSHYFIPVVKDGVCCYYDLIGKTFHYSTDRYGYNFENARIQNQHGMLPGPIVHTHDNCFPEIKMCSKLGRILGKTDGLSDDPDAVLVPTDDDYYMTLAAQDKLPTLTASSPEKTAILRKSHLTTGCGQINLKTMDSDNPVWRVLQTPEEGVDTAYDIRSYRVDNTSLNVSKIYLRFRDAGDSKNENGEVIRKWKSTIVIRKFGDVPVDVNDGVIVLKNSTRDHYAEIPFVDQLPLFEEANPRYWYYKVFSESEDGTMTSSAACEFTPYILDWEYFHRYIEDGWASSIFSIGDVITLPEFANNPSHPFSNLQCTIAAIDKADLVSSVKKHSITLIAKVPMDKVPFDTVASRTGHKFTRDEYAQNGKTYYIADRNGNKKIADVAPGTPLPVQTYYESVINAMHMRYGGNRWSTSELRRWLNFDSSVPFVCENVTTADPAYKAFVQTTPLLTQLARETDPDCVSLMKLIAPVRTKSISFRYREEDGTPVVEEETTVDKISIMSVAECMGTTTLGVRDGQYLPFFEEGGDLIWEGKSWWTRTPNIKEIPDDPYDPSLDVSFSTVSYVTKNAQNKAVTAGGVANGGNGLYVMFTLA